MLGAVTSLTSLISRGTSRACRTRVAEKLSIVLSENDIYALKAAVQEEVSAQEARKAALAGDGSVPSARQLADDPEWAASEDKKFSLAWRALRAICQEDLALFYKYDRKGDLVQLLADIDRAKAERVDSAEKVRASQADKEPKADDVDMPAVDQEATTHEGTPEAAVKEPTEQVIAAEAAPDGEDVQVAVADEAQEETASESVANVPAVEEDGSRQAAVVPATEEDEEMADAGPPLAEGL
jgi:hypothetical protein